jgi:methyltransferase
MLGVVIAQRLLELWLAERNRRHLLEQGAVEYGEEHYPLFLVLHAGWLVCWYGEVALWGTELNSLWCFWLTLFIVAQALRYWAIASLGAYWNTRILIIPGVKIVKAGPYRYFRHPNYVAVAVELACAPLIFDAWMTAALATLFNAWLLLCVRIPLEKEALKRLAG